MFNNENGMFKTIKVIIRREDGNFITLGRDQEFEIKALDGVESLESKVKLIPHGQNIGGQISATKVSERFIDFVCVHVNTAQAEIVREQLIRFFSPFKKYEIIFNYCGTSRKISGVLNERFSESKRNLWEPMEFSFGFVCADPMFIDVEPFNENMADTIPLMYVCGNQGFAIPNEGVTLSARRFDEQLSIMNDGDYETGLLINVIAERGKVINPIIENITTGKYLKLLTVLEKGDKLIINTKRGQHRIEQNGVNISHKKERGSSFFKMIVGTNILKYDAENGKTNMDVYPQWSREYFGV